MPEQRLNDSELIHEFKAAATAVTNLFKHASGNMKNAYEQGYIAALQQILDQLENDPTTDVQSWVVAQLMSITQEDSHMFAHDNENDEAVFPGEKRAHHGTFKVKRPRGE